MDAFDFLTEEDKKDVAYKACLGGTTVVGMAVGAAAGGVGAPVGAVAGLAWGMLSCKRLAEPLKKKIFASQSNLDQAELVDVLKSVREKNPMVSKPQALSMFANVREMVKKNPWDFRQGKTA